MKFIELTGRKFNRLTVIERAKNEKGRRIKWICKCECGNIAIVLGENLRSNHTQSCGCLQKDRAAESHLIHGKTHTKIFNVWVAMKERCFNSKFKRYMDYGGRGIKVCDEWKDSFQAFYDYVSQLPHFAEEGYTLDRINNDGNYEPGNVRWADWKTQANNKRKRTTRKDVN